MQYHDECWARAVHDDKELFELFSLETQVAGLSWITVLKKKNEYQKAFFDFDLDKTAALSYDDAKMICKKYKVIKSLPKIRAIIHNAKMFLHVKDEFGSIDNYFWSKINYKPIKVKVTCKQDTPSRSKLSESISKDLKKRGFKYIGAVTIYAFMCASGMVCQHEQRCYLKESCENTGLL